MIDTFFDSLAQSQRLPQTSNNHDDFSGIQNRRHTDSERHPRYSSDVIVEESSIGEDGIISEGLDTGTRSKRRPCKIENISIKWRNVQISYAARAIITWLL